MLEKLSDNNKVLLSCHHREIHYIEMHRAKMREKKTSWSIKGLLALIVGRSGRNSTIRTNNKLTTSKGRVLKKYQIRVIHVRSKLSMLDNDTLTI